MRKWVFATMGLLVLVGAAPGAQAATTDGTLITNVACGSFQSSSGMQFWVSYCATATVIVSNPCVSLVKRATPTVQSSGGTVTFELLAINCSCSNSSFNIIITDRLPDNMAYVGATTPFYTWYGAGGVPNPTWYQGGSLAYAGPYGPNLPGVGQPAPYYLRFSLDFIGPCRSAGVAFIATVL